MQSSDIVISAPAFAMFSGVIGVVVSALVGMFWLAWREKDKSYQELKLQYDARYSDIKAERDRLLNVQAQSDRDQLSLLAIIRDGVVGVAANMVTITNTMASMQRVIEQQANRPDR